MINFLFSFLLKTKKCANRSQRTENANSDCCHTKPNKYKESPYKNVKWSLRFSKLIIDTLIWYADKALCKKQRDSLMACYSVLCDKYSIAQFLKNCKVFGEILSKMKKQTT